MELPNLPQPSPRKLEDELPRREVALSRGRRLLVKREGGRWHVGYYAQHRADQGSGLSWENRRWRWEQGDSPTLRLALEAASVPEKDAGQVERYLLDHIYAPVAAA